MTLRRSERGAGANSGGNKFEWWTPTWQGMQRGILVWCWWGKFLGGPKNNQLLNATHSIFGVLTIAKKEK